MAVKKETKSFQTFRSEIQYLKQHLQVIDASLTNTGKLLEKYRAKTDPITKALKTTDGKYDTLNHPVNDYLRILNYTRAKNAEFSLIELYNAFSVYMKSILGELYRHNPKQIVGKASGNQSFTFLELINYENYENIEDAMISKVFRKLEDERSTTKLLDKILSHTNLLISDELKTDALMYLEMRHLFIHNNGKADENFKKTCEGKLIIKANNKLPTNFETVSNAINAVFKLIEFVDKELIEKNYACCRRQKTADTTSGLL